ncbi:MAG: biopolymer transporter ExbD [Steroidobacteraceae bacterium]|jgi:biopolymer transport protein ExbD|nr:biopolymer transporter ExbD [Steroidobacteraceae bacterium]
MAHSKLARRALRNHARYRGRNDLNIVPMIDMMVILVFFLIFTAVFSKTTILELNLPAPNASVPDLPEGLQLEVIVRQDRIEVADRRTGILKSLPNLPTGYDLAGLSDYLKAVKAKFPEKLDSNVLLAPDIPYDTLVQVMDTVRVWVVDDGTYRKAELFPDISVGEAPLVGDALAGSLAVPAAAGAK